MPEDMTMPPQTAWLVGSKRGAEETLAAGAKLLKFGEKGGQPKDGKKGKGKGKNHPASDEHPGAAWAGSEDWPAENEEWSWGWKEDDEWGTGEGDTAGQQRRRAEGAVVAAPRQGQAGTDTGERSQTWTPPS